MFLAGEQRVLGETHDVEHAVRFADMALVYFAKYRVRRSRPVVDSDLNFSVAKANRDLEQVPSAKQILVALETGLQARGLLPPDGACESFRDIRPPEQVAKHLAVHFRQVTLDIARARSIIGDSDPECTVTLAMLVDAITNVTKLNESLYAALNRYQQKASNDNPRAS
jgi:hypothetical protein